LSPSRPSEALEVFPVALLLAGRRCVVVGKGEELLHRARLLGGAGADVLVVTEALQPELSALPNVSVLERPFRDEDLEGAWLCVVAEPDAALSARIAGAAERRRIFCCAVDRPEQSSFIHMALARADRLIVAISTAGYAPALARRLREELCRLFEAADLAGFVTKLAELRRRTPPGERREALAPIVGRVAFRGTLELPAIEPYSNDGAPGGPGIGSGRG
jgi:siroheme synthase-like protein